MSATAIVLLLLSSSLITSVLTVAATKGLEMLQERQRHRHEIREEWLTRRLSAAEYAVNAWSRLASNAEALGVLWAEVSSDKGMAPEVFIAMNSSLSKGLSDVQEMTRAVPSTVLLYFDLPVANEGARGALADLYQSLSRVDATGNELTMWTSTRDDLLEASDREGQGDQKELVKTLEPIIEGALDRSMAACQSLSRSLHAAVEMMADDIKKLRDELRKDTA